MLKENEWNTINNILLDLYTITDINVLSQKIMRMFRILIPYTKGYFILLDEEEQIMDDMYWFVNMDESAIDKYINNYYSQDYIQYLYEISIETTVYKDTDIIHDDIRTQTDFYKQFLKPVDIPYGCGILIMKNGKIIGTFNLFRSQSLGDFSDKDIYILTVFKKHVENMVFKLLENSSQDTGYERCCESIVEKYKLTQRENEVLRLLSKGLSNNEICEELVVSISTIKKHLYNLYNKTGVKNRTQLINLLYEQSI